MLFAPCMQPSDVFYPLIPILHRSVVEKEAKQFALVFTESRSDGGDKRNLNAYVSQVAI